MSNFFFFFFDNYISIVSYTSFCFIFLLIFINFFLNFSGNSFLLFSRYLLFIFILYPYFLYFYTLFFFYNFKYSVFPFFCFKVFNFYFFNFIFLIDSLSLVFILLLFFLIAISLSISIYYPFYLNIICFNSIYPYKHFNSFDFKLSAHSYKIIFNFYFLQFILFYFFISSDFFSFYVFFELSLIPIFLIIGFYGPKTSRIKASYYIFFFTVFGSIFFFVSLIIIIYIFGTSNFFFLNFFYLPLTLKKFLWFFIFIALSIKIPIFPFHIWLPEAHVEAPTEGSIILSGLLLKIGLYGIFRILIPFFPETTLFFTPFIFMLSALTIVYISFIIFVQLDIKKIIAYSSIIHMSFVLLGIFSGNVYGVQGSIFLMFIHGIVSPALFTIIGFIYYRFNSRLFFYYQGLQLIYPLFSTFFFFFILANFGFPGTASFIGELLILFSIFNCNFFIALFSLFSIFFSAIYSLLLYLRVFNGIPNSYFFSNKFWGDEYDYYYNFFYPNKLKKKNIIPITKIEFFVLLNYSLFIFYFGLFPYILLDPIYLYSLNLSLYF